MLLPKKAAELLEGKLLETNMEPVEQALVMRIWENLLHFYLEMFEKWSMDSDKGFFDQQ